ncbi:hypothetical protein [Prescottella agglutinans]|uniref:Uncharacterized protein n=1 Tax=Prescottella agglutinans TaxID=1644129 RepID=A0ABT6MJH3_9NOCA|nr:hypothetical protein [Prescottella agglutinans]MDH6284060.1 hypothetical protein [Prescottella agglutinans]
MPWSDVIDEDFFGDSEVASRSYSPAQRRTTQQHRRLIEQFGRPTESWSRRALRACLECVATNTWSMAWGVGVIDAWADGDTAFCVVYRYHSYPRTLGLRLTVDDWPNGAAAEDPVAFGQDVATGDLGEPLGTVARNLRPDAAGIHWWGSLGESLPANPARFEA